MYDHTHRHVMEIDECTLKEDKEDCFGTRGCSNRLEPTITVLNLINHAEPLQCNVKVDASGYMIAN